MSMIQVLLMPVLKIPFLGHVTVTGVLVICAMALYVGYQLESFLEKDKNR